VAVTAGVNGHWEIRLGGLVFSGLAATSFPRLVAACPPGLHPLPAEPAALEQRIRNWVGELGPRGVLVVTMAVG
jgi:hypothetical protein